jgi:hypothetical protein
MTVANDSVLVTAGSGTTIATHLTGGKEHQVVMLATESGILYGSEMVYVYSTGNSANVAAARTTHVDLFNATGSGVVVEVWAIYIIPTLTAVTGVGLTWEIAWSSTVGSGGTTKAATLMDQANTAVGANVTCRSKPTGGSTIGSVITYPNTSSEETSGYATQASMINHLDWLGGGGGPMQPLTIRENQGMKVDQTTSSNVGSTNIILVTTIHA